MGNCCYFVVCGLCLQSPDFDSCLCLQPLIVVIHIARSAFCNNSYSRGQRKGGREAEGNGGREAEGNGEREGGRE